MTYAVQSLLPDETVVYYGRISSIIFAPAILIFLGEIGVGLAIAPFPHMGWVMAGILAVAAYFLGRAALVETATEMAVTTLRLVHNRGIRSRISEEMRLEDLESITIKRGVLGRLLGYGCVEITGTHGEFFTLPFVAEPRQFKVELERAARSVAPCPLDDSTPIP